MLVPEGRRNLLCLGSGFYLDHLIFWLPPSWLFGQNLPHRALSLLSFASLGRQPLQELASPWVWPVHGSCCDARRGGAAAHTETESICDHRKWGRCSNRWVLYTIGLVGITGYRSGLNLGKWLRPGQQVGWVHLGHPISCVLYSLYNWRKIQHLKIPICLSKTIKLA